MKSAVNCTKEAFLANLLERVRARDYVSAYWRGVQRVALKTILYVMDDTENMNTTNWLTFRRYLLNGATNEQHYAEGGCSYISTLDILANFNTERGYEKNEHRYYMDYHVDDMRLLTCGLIHAFDMIHREFSWMVKHWEGRK